MGVDRQIVERPSPRWPLSCFVAEMSPGIADEVVLMESRISASVSIPGNMRMRREISRNCERRIPQVNM
jgi:hypothetical protein